MTPTPYFCPFCGTYYAPASPCFCQPPAPQGREVRSSKEKQMPASKKLSDQECQVLYARARMAGLTAAAEAQVVPMVVVKHQNMADDSSPVQKTWVVPDGACGFAWVVIRPATSSFARWMKKQGWGGSHYGGGCSYWISDFNQSITRKEAYARAFAQVLQEAGITAYADSRLD